ncbi:MAG: MotA/TolQ/ExbB proton channel family protein [Planctomycetes bacterium]|nr:MotA/TolQ/ExbB proton channel family protein [Planctomycetota bacterium]
MLRELFDAGGVVMAPIAFASLAAWWLALSCRARLARVRDDLGVALELPPGTRLVPPAAGVLRSDAAPALDHAQWELTRLTQHLRFLGVLVGLLPLLGLLGTVSGMIGTFGTIRVQGMGDARLLAGGIREALVATETGLATALPALLLHQVLAVRLRRAELARELLLRRAARGVAP